MKIAFIIQNDSVNFKPFRNIPLNALHLTTILENNFKISSDLSIIDLRGIKKENCIYYIKENDIFLYSVTTINYPETIRTVNEIKKEYPNAKHVAGGIHVNLYMEECLKYFDSVCIGEGDELIVDITKDYQNGCLKKIYEEKRSLDINKYPHSNRSFLPKTAITETGTLNGEYKDLLGTAVLFSRGCNFKCHFCANLDQSNPRFRSDSLITEEIEYLKREYGVKSLAIKDDTILTPNVKKTTVVLDSIKKTNIKWRGNCRSNGISEELIKMAKESGCVDLAVGMESVCQNVLNNINKRTNVEKSKEFFQNLKTHDIGIRLNLIFGLPGEPKDIVKKSIDFVEEIKPSSVLLSVLTPIPGSEIYKNPTKFGINLDKDLHFDKLINVFNRFDDTEEVVMSFHYDKITPFGESMSNEEIINNYKDMQHFLRENNYIF